MYRRLPSDGFCSRTRNSAAPSRSTVRTCGASSISRPTTPSGATTSERPVTPLPACPTATTAAVVAVGQAGKGVTGRSLVVAPDGVVGLEMDEKPQVRTVDLDGAALLRVREQNPSLANRRYTVVPVA